MGFLGAGEYTLRTSCMSSMMLELVYYWRCFHRRVPAHSEARRYSTLGLAIMKDEFAPL